MIAEPQNPAPRWQPERIGVVVPAHNEEKLLPACLTALARAAAETSCPVSVVIVADSCSDNTAAVAATADSFAFDDVLVVPTRARNVGIARAVGIAALLQRHAAATLWLATTDADSTVCPEWFTQQLRYAADGAEAVVGTVRVTDWSGHPLRVRQRYAGLYHAVAGHRHAHGANLALRAAAYLDVGGFAGVPTGEDVHLVERLATLGRPIAWAHDLPVTTSARLAGRAPDGFAGYLRALAHDTLAHDTLTHEVSAAAIVESRMSERRIIATGPEVALDVAP